MKTCTVCKTEKQIAEFNSDKTKPDGHSSRCKVCQNNLSKLHYIHNKKDYQESRTRTRERRRRIMQEAKTKPCADCETEYPYWIMQFDHLEDKEFNIGSIGYHIGVERLKAEIAKCDIVCANCHAHRTRLRAIEAGINRY